MEYKKLSEVCDVRDGTHDSPKYVTEGYPLVTSKNIVDGKLDLSVINYLSQEDYDKINERSKVDVGDIIMPMIGTIGNPYIVEDFIDFAIKNVALVKFPYDSINNRYVWYYLKSESFNRYVAEKNKGGTQKFLSLGDIRSLNIPVINKNEQAEIVELLDKVSSIIDLRKDELIKLDELIKARFVELFGDAVDNPMGWEKKQLQEIVTDDCTISYGIVQTGDDQEEGVPVFRPVDIVNRVPKLNELKKTTKEISNKYKRTILKGREMLITVRANIADTCIVGEEFRGCNVGRGIVPIRTREDVIVLEFLKYLMDSKHLNDVIKSKAKGITLIQLNMEDLREVELIIPPIEQQKAFVEFAEQVDKSKVIVQKSLEETQVLFDSLMQEYFG